MQKLIDVKDAGLTSLLNEKVILFCANYFYAGVLSGVNKTFVELTDPSIVYETGEWGAKSWKDAQPLHVKQLYVRVSMIEAWAKGK